MSFIRPKRSVLPGFGLSLGFTLFYLGQYSMTWFDFAHSYLWESLIMLDTMVVFWYWVTRVLRAGAPAHAA